MSGQYVNTTTLIDTFCIRVIPGTFTQCDHTRHHSWRHFRLNMNLTTIVKDPDFIAVVDTAFLGKDLLFIAGGIGLAPLHSVINYCRHFRDRYGKIDIVYGSRSKEDLVDYPEIESVWYKEDGISVHLTIDREQPDWSGHVGFVPNYVRELGFTTDKTVVMCGPPIMIKFTLAALMELGFAREQVYTTMELKMKCALGKCGRCNIGNKYVCKDGPVFRFDQLDELPDEY